MFAPRHTRPGIRPAALRHCALGLLIGAVALLTGCDSSTDAGAEPSARLASGVFKGRHPIKAVCTTGMVADIVRQVGGPLVDVQQLMGEGVDPHLYKASTGDIARLDRADVIFYSGLHLEGKMADLFVRMARRKPTFAVTEGIDEQQILEVASGLYDPHLWFDVSLWSEAVAVVQHTLSRYDQMHAGDYAARAVAYRGELDQLHKYCLQQLATIPEQRRVLVTAHDAFHYFGRAYRLQVKAIQGITTDSEAGVNEINRLVDFICDHGIKAVFVETSVSNRNVKALIEGCRAKGHAVVIGGELFSDAMGQPGTAQGTYVGMVRHNVDTIVAALK